MDHTETNRKQSLAAILGWTRSSYVILSVFLATLIVIAVVWWPLMRAYIVYLDLSRPLWSQVDLRKKIAILHTEVLKCIKKEYS